MKEERVQRLTWNSQGGCLIQEDLDSQ